MQVVTVSAILEDPNGELVEYTVRPENRDFIRWETESKKRNWGALAGVPTLWQTFLLFSALQREKEIDSTLTFDAFQETVKHTQSSVEDVNPTKAAAGSD